MGNYAMLGTADISIGVTRKKLLQNQTKDLINENQHLRITRNGGHSRMEKIASTKTYLHLQNTAQIFTYPRMSDFLRH